MSALREEESSRVGGVGWRLLVDQLEGWRCAVRGGGVRDGWAVWLAALWVEGVGVGVLLGRRCE